jgi:hypothetical protein
MAEMERQTVKGGAFLSLWRALGGGEVRGSRELKARAFWRNGDGWSVSLNPSRGLWFCHVTGAGGNAVDLVRVALGVGTAEALRWLEEAGYRQPARRMSAAELAEQRRRREDAQRRRLEVADFRRALDCELDRLKLAAAEADDMAALEQAASLQFRLAQDPEAVFEELMKSDGRRVRWLIEEGRADREQAGKLTAVVVDLLAKAQEREGTYGRAA